MNDNNKSKFEVFCEDTSSKLSDVKIKLYDYSYAHSSAFRGQRWVKRKEITKNLQSLINSSDSKNGVYMVTGYRGVGKTSIIQELISWDKPDRGFLPIFIKALVFSAIADVLHNLGYGWWVFGGYLVATIILYFVLCYELYKIEKYLKDSSLLNKLIFWPWNATDRYINNKIPNRRYLKVTMWYFMAFCIAYISFLLHLLLTYPYAIYYSIFIYFVWYIIVILGIKLTNKKINTTPFILTSTILLAISLVTQQPKIFILALLMLIISVILVAIICVNYKNVKIFVILYLKKSFANRRKLYIKVNFGHENLSVIDIYKVMAYSLQDGLKKKYASIRNVIYRITINLTITTVLFIATDIILGGFPKKINGSCLGKHNTFQKIDTTLSTLQDNIVKYTPRLFSLAQKQEKKYSPIKSDKGENELNISGNDRTTKNQRSSSLKDHISFNYVGALIFALIYLCVWGFIYLFFYRGKNRWRVMRNLRELIDRIESEVSTEKSIGGEAKSNFSLSTSMQFKKQHKYPMADVREIERRLLEILDILRMSPFMHQRYEVVFICDELDKLEPYAGELHDGSKVSPMDGSAPDRIRARQTTIFGVLASMKYFLSSAKAKFIFVAGREMYDAAMADVSDRNAFMGSIFNEVIYVPSILTSYDDEGTPKHSTDFIEKFVCQQIMRYEGGSKDYNLRKYNSILKQNVFKESTSNELLAVQKREKIILTLHHFMVYLNHMSNGSTKKMISLFENYVETAGEKDKDREIFFGAETIAEGELYLKFTADDQQLFAMINYLAGPTISVQKSQIQYADKLLVQTSYIVDHLLKHHKQAFTEGNLELIPEVIDPYRSPGMRRYVEDTIARYLKTHLEPVSFNLHDFKFNDQIRREIIYLSQISEQASAAFNFSLDESQSMKRHFELLLKKVESEREGSKEVNNLEAYNNSFSAISCILGDLHFYDEQYEEAIRYYARAISPLKANGGIDARNLFFYVKMALKQGLTFEKRKAETAAFTAYQEALNATMKVLWGCKFDERQNITHKLEFSRLLYQPILAKLYLVEKNSPTGVSIDDLQWAVEMFNKLYDGCDAAKTYLFYSDFCYKLAILVYGKSFKDEKNKKLTALFLYNGICTIHNRKPSYYNNSRWINSCELEEYDANTIINRVNYEIKKSKDIENRASEDLRMLSKLITFLGDLAFCNKGINGIAFEYFRVEGEKVNFIENKIIFLYYKSAEVCRLNGDYKGYIFNMTKVLYLIKMSIPELEGLRYAKSFLLRDAFEIGSHILRAAYAMNDFAGIQEVKKFIGFFEEDADKTNGSMQVSLKRTTIAMDLEEVFTLLGNIEILCLPDDKPKKYEELVKIFKRYTTTPYCLGTTSLNRILWLKSRFHLNYEIFSTLFNIEDNNDFNITKKELKNKKEKEEVLSLLNKTPIKEGIDNEQMFEYFLYDSIYCGMEIVKLYKAHSDGWLLSYLFLPKMQKNMVFWLKILKAYKEYLKGYNNSKAQDSLKKLEDLIGKERMQELSVTYFEEEAQKNFELALSIYDEKAEYKRDSQRFCYLNDDLCDQRAHFFTALDRVELDKIRSEKIKKAVPKQGHLTNEYYSPSKYLETVINTNEEETNKA